MTRKKAIVIMQNEQPWCKNPVYFSESDRYEAYHMAIEALKTEPCEGGMTREEKAIIYFKDMRKRLCEDYLSICPKNSIAYKATLAEKDFYDSAINALEKEINCETLTSGHVQEIKAECGDCISRKAVLEVIRKCHCEEWVKAEIGAHIEALSPVNP